MDRRTPIALVQAILGKLAPSFVYEAELGDGAQGTVLRFRDTRCGAAYAVEVVEEADERYQAEKNALSRSTIRTLCASWAISNFHAEGSYMGQS
jgi:hypothetical protein